MLKQVVTYNSLSALKYGCSMFWKMEVVNRKNMDIKVDEVTQNRSWSPRSSALNLELEIKSPLRMNLQGNINIKYTDFSL
jgi:hypothetical protein